MTSLEHRFGDQTADHTRLHRQEHTIGETTRLSTPKHFGGAALVGTSRLRSKQLFRLTRSHPHQAIRELAENDPLVRELDLLTRRRDACQSGGNAY
jgi:hypothetical protein